MAHFIEDLNRRDINLSKSVVKEVLPEYFSTDYPDLITFLEKYYDFIDSTGNQSFKNDIDNIITLRDITQTTLESLDQLVAEIGNGLQVASFFEQPRLMTRLLAQFYRSKGTLVSAEGFFRAFYNEEVTIEYPKDQIFIVGESEIGAESLRFIINDKLYQTFSILIKAGISVADYQELYKKFVHPAGFYFAGQVETSGQVTLSPTTTPVDPLDSAEAIVLIDQVTLDPQPLFTQMTALLDSDGQDIRVNVTQLISDYQNLTAGELDNYYDNIAQILTPNSFTFDDDSAGGARPDVAMDVETMDNTMYTRYLSDSAY